MLIRNFTSHGSSLRYFSGAVASYRFTPNGSWINPQTATSQYAGVPVGARHPVAYAMALKSGGVACHILASSSFVANASGSYANATVSINGLSSMSANGFLTAERTVTMSGTSSMSASSVGSYANGQVNIRIGFNPSADDIANAVLDTSNVEQGMTVRQALRLIAAAVVGKVSGAPAGPIVIRAAVQDHKVRITATVDGSGNASAVTTDVT